jgi:S-layer homology domain
VVWGLAAILAMVVLACSSTARAQSPFADVPAGHPAEAAVNELAKQGFINGYADGSYGGNRAMTRYELAIVLQRLLQQSRQHDFTPRRLPPMPPPPPPLTDVPKDHWAADAVQEAHAYGILRGRPDGTFDGQRVMTRAEIAMVLQRLLAYATQIIELNRQPPNIR